MQRTERQLAANKYHAVHHEHDAALSSEAQTFRRLLRYHIAVQMSKRNLQMPQSFTNEVQLPPPSASTSRGDTIKTTNTTPKKAGVILSNDLLGGGSDISADEKLDLDAAFNRLAVRFEHDYQSDIERFVANMGITSVSIETNVLGVIREIFADQRVTWGRLVALTAFITFIAFECSRAELTHTIEPLIDHTAHIAEEQIVPFVREHGGWKGFVEFFDLDVQEAQQSSDDEQAGSMTSFSKLATYAAGAIGVGVLTAFLARK